MKVLALVSLSCFQSSYSLSIKHKIGLSLLQNENEPTVDGTKNEIVDTNAGGSGLTT